MSTLTIEQETQAILEAEQRARTAAIAEQVRQRREREREAAEHAALVASCKARLAALDTAPIEKLHAKASAALDAYVAAMAAHNAQIASIRDELAALGSNLPATVDTGSHANGWGVTIGDIEVRRQRLQTNVSRMAKDVLRTHITRGPISLDNPPD